MTRAREWAAKVDRAATDPARIVRRKGIAPALVVERSTFDVDSTFSPAETPALQVKYIPAPPDDSGWQGGK